MCDFVGYEPVGSTASKSFFAHWHSKISASVVHVVGFGADVSLAFPQTPPFEDPKILPRAIFGRAAHTKKRAAQKKQHKTKKNTTQHNTTHQQQQQQQQQLWQQQPASLSRLVSLRRPGGRAHNGRHLR